MKYDQAMCSLMVESESSFLQDRIEEISRSTRATLADAAEKLRAEMIRRNQVSDDNLPKIAEMLEKLAYGEP